MSNSRHGGCLIDRRHKGLPCWKCHADCVNILSTSSCCLTQNAEQFNGISLRNEVQINMLTKSAWHFHQGKPLWCLSIKHPPCLLFDKRVAKFLTYNKDLIEMEDPGLPKTFCPYKSETWPLYLSSISILTKYQYTDTYT